MTRTDTIGGGLRIAGATLVVGALCGLSALPAAADGTLPEPTVSQDGARTVLTVHTRTTSSSFTPKGGQPTLTFPESAPVPGDVATEDEDLTQAGTTVGTDTLRCTVPVTGTLRCVGNFSFANGTITTLNSFDDADPHTEGVPFPIAITGGTGAYAGAQGNGSVLNKGVVEDEDDIVFTYSTAGRSQVSEVPAGGAALGGGSEAGSETGWLLALGAVAAVAGGGVLIARGRG